GEGQKIGDTPVSVDLGKVNGKVLRVTQDKKIPEYWIVSCDTRRDRLEAKLRLHDAPTIEGPAIAQEKKEEKKDTSDKKECEKVPAAPSLSAINRSHRQLLRAYEALISEDAALARDLADQLAKDSPELAAPFIIIGLSYLQEGDRDQARRAFTKAE